MNLGRLRYTDVQISEEYFAGGVASGLKILDPPAEFELADGETVAWVTERTEYGGAMNHYGTLYARVWIVSEESP